jgi:hypothetical protein
MDTSHHRSSGVVVTCVGADDVVVVVGDGRDHCAVRKAASIDL